jgi:DNA polymerase-3 subunit chi
LTEIAFHFNAADRLNYVCRLLRKAAGGGAKVVVTGPADDLAQLDAALWVVSGTDFVPHCDAQTSHAVLTRTPVVLAQSLDVLPFFDVLVNLGDSVPSGFDRFERLIEVVTLDADDRRLARGRWKYYADAGFSLIRHDLQKATS